MKIFIMATLVCVLSFSPAHAFHFRRANVVVNNGINGNVSVSTGGFFGRRVNVKVNNGVGVNQRVLVRNRAFFRPTVVRVSSNAGFYGNAGIGVGYAHSFASGGVGYNPPVQLATTIADPPLVVDQQIVQAPPPPVYSVQAPIVALPVDPCVRGVRAFRSVHRGY